MTAKERLNEAITELHAATKRGEMPRPLRLVKIEALTEEYRDVLDDKALERLSDLVLYEELTDNDRMKVRNNEYPFFSETQFEERYKAEASFKFAEEHGVDGRDYSPPLRRKRTNKDNKFVDKNARIRNKERKHRYVEFTRVQPVISYKIGD